jgi:hypothetical protein
VSELVASFAPLSGYYAVNAEATVRTASGAVFCHAVDHSSRSGTNTSPTNVAYDENTYESDTLGMAGGMGVAPGSTIQMYCEASRTTTTSGNSNQFLVESLAITATQVRTTHGDGPDHAARVAAKPLNSFVKPFDRSRDPRS